MRIKGKNINMGKWIHKPYTCLCLTENVKKNTVSGSIYWGMLEKLCQCNMNITFCT